MLDGADGGQAGLQNAKLDLLDAALARACFEAWSDLTAERMSDASTEIQALSAARAEIDDLQTELARVVDESSRARLLERSASEEQIEKLSAQLQQVLETLSTAEARAVADVSELRNELESTRTQARADAHAYEAEVSRRELAAMRKIAQDEAQVHDKIRELRTELAESRDAASRDAASAQQSFAAREEVLELRRELSAASEQADHHIQTAREAEFAQAEAAEELAKRCTASFSSAQQEVLELRRELSAAREQADHDLLAVRGAACTETQAMEEVQAELETCRAEKHAESSILVEMLQAEQEGLVEERNEAIKASSELDNCRAEAQLEVTSLLELLHAEQACCVRECNEAIKACAEFGACRAETETEITSFAELLHAEQAICAQESSAAIKAQRDHAEVCLELAASRAELAATQQRLAEELTRSASAPALVEELALWSPSEGVAGVPEAAPAEVETGVETTLMPARTTSELLSDGQISVASADYHELASGARAGGSSRRVCFGRSPLHDAADSVETIHSSDASWTRRIPHAAVEAIRQPLLRQIVGTPPRSEFSSNYRMLVDKKVIKQPLTELPHLQQGSAGRWAQTPPALADATLASRLPFAASEAPHGAAEVNQT